MLRPLFLARASIGLVATAVEHVAALPTRAGEAIGELPGIPVRVAGGLMQSYMHAGQTMTALAVKGDQVLGTLLPAHFDQPEWATFDEDVADPDETLDVSYTVYGSTAPRGTGVEDSNIASGRVGRRRR